MAATRSPRLLSSFVLGDLTLKNRVVMAPMTRARAGVERVPNALMAEYYAQRAGAGLIVTEATVISQQGNGWNQSPGIYNDEQTNAWRQVVEAVHAKGAPIFLQLWHCGRASHSSFQPDGGLPVSASAIALGGDYIHTPTGKQPYETPRPLATDELPGIVADYRAAAQRARDAGFDGVEIHAANGYLLDQFLQSKTNKRTDIYGGGVAGRYRLLGEVVEAVCNTWPERRVGVRISPNGNFNDMGSEDFRDTFLYVAEKLDEWPLSYLHVVDGLGFGFHELGEAMTLAEFREVFSKPLVGNCGYDQASAEAAIAVGDADLIAFGRPYISNPDLAERFANNWPLAEPADMSVWYSYDEAGYADWPKYEPTAERET
jgi:N-ethylmaleimide reductase